MFKAHDYEDSPVKCSPFPRPVHLSFKGRKVVQVRVIALQRLNLATVNPLRRSDTPHVPGEIRVPAQEELVVVTALLIAVSEECENGATQRASSCSRKCATLQLRSHVPHLSQRAFDRIPTDEARSRKEGAGMGVSTSVRRSEQR